MQWGEAVSPSNGVRVDAPSTSSCFVVVVAVQHIQHRCKVAFFGGKQQLVSVATPTPTPTATATAAATSLLV
jgi:hypothetical protein